MERSTDVRPAPPTRERASWLDAARAARTTVWPAAVVAALVLGAAVAVAPAAAVLLLALVAALGVVLARRPPTGDVVLHLLVASMFVESLGAGPLSAGRVVAVIAVLAVGARLLSGTRSALVPPSAVVPVAALAALFVLSGAWSEDTAGWLFALGQLGLALAFFAAFAVLPRSTAVVRPLLRTFVVGAVLAGALGLAQTVTAERAVGLQGDPNIYALYQVAALPAAVGLARSATRRWSPPAYLLAMLPIGASVLASESRGALVALVPVLLLSTLLMTHPGRRGRWLVLASAVVAGVGTTAFATSERFDLERVATDRASGRFDIWFVAWQAFLDRPLTGLGSGNFVTHSIELLTTVPGVELIRSHLLTSDGIEVHNLYLESLAERGIPGLVVTVWLLVQTTMRLLHARRPDRPELDCLLPMLAAFAVASVFLSVANSKLFWMLVGLSVILPVARPPRAQAPPPTTRPSLESLP